MRLIAHLLISWTFIYTPQVYAACAYETLSVHGLDRTELVCGPMIASAHPPVMLVFHGRGGNAKDMAEGTRLHEAWPEAVVVYLDGLPGIPAPYDREGRYPGWQLHQGEMNDRDVEFSDAALDDLSRNFDVDKRRIFAVGHSNGASFLGVLWTIRAARYAGFAFSASQADRLIETAEPRPVFMGMGLHDELIPFDVQKRSINYAASRLGVRTLPVESPGVSQRKNKDGIELMTFIHPGGHSWPPEQTQMIVEFLKRQKLKSVPVEYGFGKNTSH